MLDIRGLKIRWKIILPLVALTVVYALVFSLLLVNSKGYTYPVLFSLGYFLFCYFFVTWLIRFLIEDRVSDLTRILNRLADGFIEKKLDVENNDQIGEMGQAVNELIDTLNNISVQASNIAKGNLSTRIKPKSRIDMFSRTFNRMVESLEDSDINRKHEEWLKTNQSKLLSMIRNDQEVETLSKSILKFICELLNLQIGAFYLADPENDSLKLIAGYSFNERKHVNEVIKPGRGLVGQVYIEKETITISNPPNDYFDVKWSFGSARPDYIIGIPVIFNNEVLGVFELASIYDPQKMVLDFLNLVLHDIATSLKTAIDTKKMKSLFEEVKLKQSTFKTLFENSADNMRIISKDFEMLDANNKFLEMMGLTREQVKGKKCYEIFPGKDCHTSNCPVVKIVEQGKDLSKTKMTKKVKGIEKDFYLSTFSLMGGNKNIIGIVENYNTME